MRIIYYLHTFNNLPIYQDKFESPLNNCCIHVISQYFLWISICFETLGIDSIIFWN